MALNLERLQTESRNPESNDIDVVSTVEMCRIINMADHAIAPSITSCIPQIALCINLIVERVRKGGRVIYVGAGTSGRLGVLDASEIPPTFSAPPGVFDGIIAGTDIALRRAVEGAEDLPFIPSSISPPLTENDTLIGIATSGRTPYVISALSYAKKQGALVLGLAFVSPSEIKEKGDCEVVIECVVGPEVITGSTRMKAGSGTKMILNMISTGVMIRLGKSFGNLMIDLAPTNHKLLLRAQSIFRTLLPHSILSDTEIQELIKQKCGGSLKLALVVAKLGCEVEDARARLENCGGVLKLAWADEGEISKAEPGQGTNDDIAYREPVVLCVDAGGTKCSAVIANKSGVIGRATGGPCNFVTLGHEAALTTLKALIDQSLFTHTGIPRASNAARGKASSTGFIGVKFAAAWIGGAGLDRVSDLQNVKSRIGAMLGVEEGKIIVSSDATLLAAAIALPLGSGIESNVKPRAPISALPTQSRTGAVLVLGTGSIAYSFAIPPHTSPPIPTPLKRTGGWGYLLGDEGSAYDIGRIAVSIVLRERDNERPLSKFMQEVVECLGCEEGEVISAVYDPARGTLKDPKLRIAQVCRVVFKHAFPPAPATGSSNGTTVGDSQALETVLHAAQTAARNLLPLFSGSNKISPSDSTLVLGGALSQVKEYREAVLGALKQEGHVFARVEVVDDAPGRAIHVLVERFNFL